LFRHFHGAVATPMPFAVSKNSKNSQILPPRKLVKISLRRFEGSARLLMPERARAQSHDAVALRNIFVDLVRNHLPIVAESGEVTFHFLFGVGGAGEFHGSGPPNARRCRPWYRAIVDRLPSMPQCWCFHRSWKSPPGLWVIRHDANYVDNTDRPAPPIGQITIEAKHISLVITFYSVNHLSHSGAFHATGCHVQPERVTASTSGAFISCKLKV
jgi:hypothetical protein